jgi:hypothetical protein
MFELTKEKLEDRRCQIGTSNRVPTMFNSRSDDIICSAPLFRAGPDKLSVVICVNLCPFACPVGPRGSTGTGRKIVLGRLIKTKNSDTDER